MISKAFKIIEEKLIEELQNSDFSKCDQSDNSITFKVGEAKYSVIYDSNRKIFELSVYSANDGDDDSKQLISSWLFDLETDTEREIGDIAQDFANTISGKDALPVRRVVRKKKRSDEDNTSNPLFLMNRIASIFPELKESVLEEKESFENFRGVTFTREKVLPVIGETLNTGKPGDKFKKLCTVMSNLYSTGDQDTRSIITIVILNSVDDQDARARILDNVSDTLKDAMKEAFRFRGKKVKPEKVKKRSTFISDTLNAANSQ